MKCRARARRHIVERDCAALRCVETTRRHILLTGRAMLRRRVVASLVICSWRRSRYTVATADGTRHPQLQPALSSAEQVSIVLALE